MPGTINLEDQRSALAKWLERALPGASRVEVAGLERPAAGNSAETVFMTVAYDEGGERRTRRMVLRRQLEGFDLSLNADLGHQYRVLQAMGRHAGALTPGLVGLEPGRDLLGAPFYVMERVEGRTVQQYPNYNKEGWLADALRERQALVWGNAVRKIADIHRIDWRDGFDFLHQPRRGEPGLDQYLHHLDEWYRWAARGRTQPVGDAAMDYLRRNQPRSDHVSVLWGDAIPANMLFDDEGGVAAVIDWELAGLGPGEIDLGWWLFFDTLFSSGTGFARLSGLPDRAETIRLYEEAADRQVADMDYFEVLANLRLAIIAVRQADRQVAFGAIPPTSRAWIDNPVNRMLAARLGLPEPEVGEDFAAMQRARAH